MKGDPLDSLQAFYEECRMAPVPDGIVAKPLPGPWWLRLAVPVSGLGFGAFLAAALVLSPTKPSPEAGTQAARAIARRQLAAAPPPRPRAKAIRERRTRWNA